MATEIESLLAVHKTKKAWRVAKVLYRSASERPPTSCFKSMEKQTLVACQALAQINVDIAILQETKMSSDIYARQPHGYEVLVAPTNSRGRRARMEGRG